MKRTRRNIEAPKTGLCFFCQRRYPISRLTKEHVFAQWLIDRAGIRDASIVFPNGTATRYSKITVPACSKCNNEFGSQFETQIRKILDDYSDYRDELLVNSLPIETVYTSDDSAHAKLTLWLQKLVLGLLYFQAHLVHVPPDTIRMAKNAFKSSITFRNTCRSIVSGRGCNLAASLFVFELDEAGSPDFDFVDSIEDMCVCLRIDRKVFIVAIGDGRLVNNYFGGEGLENLRKDVFTGRYGQNSHLAAFAFITAVRRHLPTSPKFITSNDRIINMSNWGLGGPPPMDQQAVSEEARLLFREFRDRRPLQEDSEPGN